MAAIKAAFAVVKGLVGNFYTGGYTGSGSWDQPQGIVHSNGMRFYTESKCVTTRWFNQEDMKKEHVGTWDGAL